MVKFANENVLLETTQSKRIRVLESARMLVNDSSNINGYEMNISDTFRIFNTVLKESGSSFNFQKSMSNSQEFFENENTITESLGTLNLNNSDSFLVVPIRPMNHLFSALLRKVSIKDTQYFSVILANMGNKANNNKFGEYLFDDYKKLENCLSISKLENISPISIEDVYKSFDRSSTNKFSLNLTSKNQVIGNCFTKEIEKGIKLATLPLEILIASRKSNSIEKPVKFTLNNNPLSTQKIHSDYLDILKKENPSFSSEIEDIKESYLINKLFRKNIKDEIVLSNKVDIKNLAKNLSYKSILFCVDNSKIFSSFASKNRHTNPQILKFVNDVIHKLRPIFFDIEDANNVMKNINHIKRKMYDVKSEYPNLIKTYTETISDIYLDAANSILDKNDSKNFSKAEMYLKKASKYNPNSSGAFGQLAYIKSKKSDYNFKKQLQYLEEATKIKPSSLYYNNQKSILYKDLGDLEAYKYNFKKALNYYRVAMKLAPDNNQKDEIKQKIQFTKRFGLYYFIKSGKILITDLRVDYLKLLAIDLESKPNNTNLNILNKCYREPKLKDITNKNSYNQKLREVFIKKVCLGKISMGNLNTIALKFIAKKLDLETPIELHTLKKCYRALRRKDKENQVFYNERLEKLEGLSKKSNIFTRAKRYVSKIGTKSKNQPKIKSLME